MNDKQTLALLIISVVIPFGWGYILGRAHGAWFSRVHESPKKE